MAWAQRGWTVISGLALGIDAAAHEGALAGKGLTGAVLGSGVDLPSPERNRPLAQRILRRGFLVSEFPPGTRAAPFHFPRRNRILAALADAVVVVEAGPRSGALITADHALDLGRPVLAVPGPIDRPESRGANRLIRDGATPVLGPDDLASGPTGGGASDRRTLRGTAGPPTEPRDGDDVQGLAADAEALLGALGRGARTPDQLSGVLGLRAAEVLVLLSRLELSGLVVRGADGGWSRAVGDAGW
jgi:DNA processing protein